MLHPIAEEVRSFAEVVWVLRDKDVSVRLADALGLKYILISQAASGLIGNGIELFQNIVRCRRITRHEGIDMWVTMYGCGNIAAWLSPVRSVSFADDDAEVVPLSAWTSYPCADMVLVTQFTRMGRFSKKAIRYAGCTELCYLHPNRFTPDESVRIELGVGADEPYAIVRLAALTAHHDLGIRGISENLLRSVLQLTRGCVRLFVSSEKPLPPEFETLGCPIKSDRMLHALAHAEFFLGDGQTMATEAAVLGTPSFRINDFVGRISSMEDVATYELTFGFKPDQEDDLLSALERLLDMPDRKEVFARRRKRFLAAKIDPVPWHSQAIRMVLEDAKLCDMQAWAERHGTKGADTAPCEQTETVT